MVSKYREIYKITVRLWTPECPVILERAALFMKDNNAIISLHRFRNITTQRIKAMYLSKRQIFHTWE